MALAIGLILVSAGFLRVVLFKVALLDAVAISASLFVITSSSVVLGAVLPLALNAIRLDAAHASTTVQVVMDILGVLLTCTISTTIFTLASDGAAPAWAAPLLGG